MMIEAMDSCSQAPRGPYNRICSASIGAPQREKPSSPTSNARTDRSCQVPESGVRGNPPAPFGRGERPQGPTYPYHVRKYNHGVVLTTPSKKNVKAFLKKVRGIIEKHRDSSAGQVIVKLNPVIRGWANYHRFGASSKTFNSIGNAIFKKVWWWARRRHPRKSATWVKQKYFTTEGTYNWVFTGEVKDEEGNRKLVHLRRATDVKIQRHTPIQGEANPYDLAWETYFEKRLDVKTERDLTGKRRLLHLWKEQKGLCPMCNQRITKITGWHSHHVIWRSKGGTNRTDNLILLHPNCHMQLHSQGFSVRNRVPPTRRGVRKA